MTSKANLFRLKSVMFPVVGWVILGLILFVTDWVPSGVALMVVFAAFIATVIAHTRYHTRFATSTWLKTPCPECGNLPMRFTAPSDNHYYLACDKCQIEWDLGPN